MKTEKILWQSASLLLVAASCALCLRFWLSAAYKDGDMIPHAFIAVSALLGYYAGLVSLVSSWISGAIGRALLAGSVVAICFCLNCIAQSGAYAYQEYCAARDRQQVTDSAAYAEKAATAALDDSAARRQALQDQAAMLDSEIARLSAQSADFAARNIVTKGVTLVENQIADLRAKRSEVTAQMAGIQTALPDAPVAVLADGRNAFSSFFDTASALTGRKPEFLRAGFFFGLPLVHELIAGAGVVFLATLRRREDESEDVTPGKSQGPETSPT